VRGTNRDISPRLARKHHTRKAGISMPGDLDSRPPEAGQLRNAFDIARERYAALGVDVERALEALGQISLSLHCWQGDDVAGFESPDTVLSGGIAATGNYPGKARNAGELRSDLDKAYSLIPGKHR